jgi:transposase
MGILIRWSKKEEWLRRKMKKRQKFTPEQISALQALINNKESSKSEALRAQAVLLINAKANPEQIQLITGLDGKYAFKLRKKYLETGISSLTDKRKKKPRALLTRGQREQIAKILAEATPKEFGFEATFWTTAILGWLIKEQYGVQYKSKTPLYLLFKQAKFSFHKPGGVYRKRNQEEVDAWKKEMAPVLKNAFDEEKVVILVADEMILSTQTTFQKIWLPQGEYPKIDISNKRDRRCIYGFLNIKTGREHAFKTEKINSEETRKILDQIGNLYKNKKIILIWDGAPWHRSDEIKEFLTSTKHSFQLFRFPPYTPDENPQEHVWKAGRSHITHNKFIGNIDTAADEFVKYLNNTDFNYKLFDPGVILK